MDLGLVRCSKKKIVPKMYVQLNIVINTLLSPFSLWPIKTGTRQANTNLRDPKKKK